MVRLPGLVGSEPPSLLGSPLKSFPWMRFAEDIAWDPNVGLCTRLGKRKEEKDRKRVKRKIEI